MRLSACLLLALVARVDGSSSSRLEISATGEMAMSELQQTLVRRQQLHARSESTSDQFATAEVMGETPSEGEEGVRLAVDGWNYEFPNKWSEMEPQCAGRKQSPILLPSTADSDSPDLLVEQLPLRLREALNGMSLVNNGHTLKVSFSGDQTLGFFELGAQHYDVKSLHFHFPSEHSFPCISNPLGGCPVAGEMHLTTQLEGASGTDSLLMVAILFDVGAENEFLTTLGFSDTLPSTDEPVHVVTRSFNVAASFHEQLSNGWYRYRGSLTSPPCTEGVKWFVMKKRAEASPLQIEQFKRLFPDPANNRPTQDLNGRSVMSNVMMTPDDKAAGDLLVTATKNRPKMSEWSYSHPAEWPTLAKACGGKRQSPVFVSAPGVLGADGKAWQAAGAAPQGPAPPILPVSYANVEAGLTMMNNGRGLTVNGNFGSFSYFGSTYVGKQLAFHFPSEHTFPCETSPLSGCSAAGEVQIVHQLAGALGTAGLLVVSIMLDEPHARATANGVTGDGKSALLDNLGWDSLPPPDADADVVKAINLSSYFRKIFQGGWYRYDGSMTVPPCTEDVKWFVMAERETVSTTQVAAFKALFPEPEGHRPPQPLNGRTLVSNSMDTFGTAVHAVATASAAIDSTADNLQR